MADLPSGTVTFLFTDIEGSTARWERDPEAMQACLARHSALLRDSIASRGGWVFKSLGDGVCAAFTSAADALDAALSAQRALGTEPWPEGSPLLVRMAVHTAAVQPEDGDYVGPPLNRTARLLAAAHGGQILVSATTRDMVHDSRGEGIDLVDLGEHRLKDIARAERIYQVAAPDLRRDFPPLSTLERRLHNLPLPRTSLVGRKEELARAKALLLDAATGLLTLTGSPGSGKTRLAVQLASEVAGSFPDGVFFVALAPVRDPTALASTIASALGVRQDSAQAPQATLLEFLRHKQLLLVLDNFEQLLPAAPTVAGLLEASHRVKVLVTSRAALRIRGEREMAVPPLPWPAPGTLPGPSEIARYPAVELFVQRASAVRPDFHLDDVNAAAVARICGRLDGLPLAIELAASRIQLLNAVEILSRLERRSDVLTAGARDLPERQRTLRGAIAWSHELLGPAAQRLFRRMAVFAGGFTLETAEAVCGFDIDTESGVLDALGILLENHLVERVRVVDGDETPRFDMLETIRGYAQEQLTRSGEAPALRRRHAEAYVTLGEESEPELTGPRQGVWLRRLEAEAHNIRAALAWSLEANEPELGLRLAGAVWLVWHKHSHWGQDGSWLDQLLDRGDHVSSVVRAKALNGAGSMAADRGDLARAIACFDEGLSLGHQLRDERTQAVALGKLGALACLRGDYARARSLQRESLTLSRSIEDRPGIARALLDLATVTVFEGDPEAAIPLYEESLKLLRRLGDPWKLAMALQNLASALRPRRAHARMRELLEEAIELYRSVDATGGVASARLTLGAIALDDGDPVAAASLFKEAVQEFHQEGDIPELAYGIDYLGQAAAATGDPVRAARLMGAVEAVRAAAGLRCGASYRASRDRVLASVRAQLGDQRFQAAITQGASLPLDRAVREALAVNVPLPGAGDRNSRAAPASFSPPC